MGALSQRDLTNITVQPDQHDARLSIQAPPQGKLATPTVQQTQSPSNNLLRVHSSAANPGEGTVGLDSALAFG